MSTSKNALDDFERRLKDSLDQFEVPYNSSDWIQLERSLNNGRSSWWLGAAGISLLFSAAVGLAGGVWLYTSKEKTTQETGAIGETSVGAMAPAERMTTASRQATTMPSAAAEPTPQDSNLPAAQRSLSTSSVPNEHSDAIVQTRPSTTHDAKQTAANAGLTTVLSTKQEAKQLVPSKGGAAITTKMSDDGLGAFTASLSEGCVGTSVDFKVEHMPEDGIYLWNFGDGSFSNKANPEHTFTKPGSYQVMLSMSAAGVGTIHNKPSSDLIVIHDVPKAAFNVLKQEYDGHLPSVHFENRSLSGKEYQWNFGDGETSTIAHPDHIYKTKGVYQVELTVTNEIGCTDKVMKDVRIDKDYNLDAPTSFSPNGDGHEETFMPEALRTLGVKFRLSIYDPNGTLIYETTDATKPWLGKPNNRGELCTPADYVWVADVRESLHLGETYTGKVHLER